MSIARKRWRRNKKKAVAFATSRLAGPLLSVVTVLVTELGQIAEIRVWNTSCGGEQSPLVSLGTLLLGAAALQLPMLGIRSKAAQAICNVLQLILVVAAGGYLSSMWQTKTDGDCADGGHLNEGGEVVYAVLFLSVLVACVEVIVLVVDRVIGLILASRKRRSA